MSRGKQSQYFVLEQKRVSADTYSMHNLLINEYVHYHPQYKKSFGAPAYLEKAEDGIAHVRVKGCYDLQQVDVWDLENCSVHDARLERVVKMEFSPGELKRLVAAIADIETAGIKTAGWCTTAIFGDLKERAKHLLGDIDQKDRQLR